MGGGVAERGHVPVLPREVAEALSLGPGQTYVDCTAGLGGHAEAAGRAVGPEGLVVLSDLDAGNLARAEARVRATGTRVEARHGNFAELPGWLAARGVRADGVLADLGFASVQVDDPERGLSFRHDGPLDMRLDPNASLTAAAIVNGSDEAELADIVWRFGEDRHARRIARKVVASRADGPILTTRRLAEIVRSACPPGGPSSRGGIDAATRTFQALRIVVNDELGSLDRLLRAITLGAEQAGRASGWLAPGARIAIIAFHSLEDRPVKQALGDLVRRGLAEPVFRGVVSAGEAELAGNPRARSAKMRSIRLRDAAAG
jgi:16S rRNA (cytosine1402-N4)-methyltransferase